MSRDWDLVIVGAGPAGLTAGIYAARSGLKTVIIEEKMPGGLAVEAHMIENYPGFLEVSGLELANMMIEQAKKSGVKINSLERVSKLNLRGRNKTVETDHAIYQAPALIISTGCYHRSLGVTGEDKFRGRGVSYCALCDGPFFKAKKVVVVGGGNSAAKSAIYLSNLAHNVRLIHQRDALRAEGALVRDLKQRGVELILNTIVKEIKGDMLVTSIVLFNDKNCKTIEIEADGVFINIGEAPNSQIAREAGVKTDQEGYIVIDTYQKTNIEGVYAAGDVTTYPVKQIGTAIGQAIVAATKTFEYVKRPYYYKDSNNSISGL